MAQTIILGHPDGRLCGEMAASVAAFLTKSTEVSAPGCNGAQFYHWYTSSFEKAVVVLLALGVITPRPPEERPHETFHCWHELTLDCEAMPDFLARKGGPGAELFGQTLSMFIDVGCNYTELSEERSPFAPPAMFARAMSGLARRGYAEHTNGEYFWTDKIGPVMQGNWLWDDNLCSYKTLERDETEAMAELAWRTMPVTIRNAHFSKRPVELPRFIRTLNRCWKDGKWHPTSQEDSVGMPSGGINLARRIIEIADGRC